VQSAERIHRLTGASSTRFLKFVTTVPSIFIGSASEMSKTEPNHYEFPNGAKVIDITRHLGFLEGNVVKYAARAGRKDGESRLDDLRKARWYIERAIEEATDDELEDLCDPLVDDSIEEVRCVGPFEIVALPHTETILQGHDEYFSEMDDEWHKIPPHAIGLWADDWCGPHVHLRGYAGRISDATHHSRFKAKYGREKPPHNVTCKPSYFNRGEEE